jgi:mannose-6-phosphate isomerase-like protein (cupin superfamily)
MIYLATMFLMMAAGDGITYVPAKDVAAAQLVKPPAPIITADHYLVMSVKRTVPGQSEVHAKETDVFYVIDGAATFITGGTLVDGKTTAPDQIRGSSIKGGESRHVAKGDVITIPKGVPHWVSAVEGSVTYIVVKVM